MLVKGNFFLAYTISVIAVFTDIDYMLWLISNFSSWIGPLTSLSMGLKFQLPRVQRLTAFLFSLNSCLVSSFSSLLYEPRGIIPSAYKLRYASKEDFYYTSAFLDWESLLKKCQILKKSVFLWTMCIRLYFETSI